MRACMCARTQAHVCTRVCACALCICVCMCVYACVHVCVRVRTHDNSPDPIHPIQAPTTTSPPPQNVRTNDNTRRIRIQTASCRQRAQGKETRKLARISAALAASA